MRRIIIVIVIAGLLAAGYFGFRTWQAGRLAAAAATVQTQPAEHGPLTSTIGATGVVRSQQTVLLTWRTTGTVKEVAVQVGDKVAAGERLAELAQSSLPQAVIMAQSELITAQKALDDLNSSANSAVVAALQSISTYTKAVRDAQYQLDNFSVPTEMQAMEAAEALTVMQTRLDEARAAFEPVKYAPSGDARRTELRDKLAEAQSNYDTAIRRLEYEFALRVAQSNLENAREDYERWKNGPDPAEVTAAEARIAAAQATLGLAWIEAPLTGTVTLVETMPGDQVTAGSQAFRIDDFSKLMVDLSISEVDINQVSEGRPVRLTFDAVRGREYNGVVTSVDRVGTLNQGAVEFIVTVTLENADDAVRPGMTAAVNVVIEQLEDVLLVPNRAVRFRDGQTVVYILKDGVPTAVKIELGASSDVSSEVTGGDLQAGDPIVLNPPTVFEGGGGPPFMR